MSAAKRKRKNKFGSLVFWRRAARRAAVCLTLISLLFCLTANWFVRHPLEWIEAKYDSLPDFLVSGLVCIGEPFADITDSWGITGSDAVCEIADTSHIGGRIFFAGPPVKKSPKAPDDIIISEKGEFTIGYSNRLRHPVWCAYRIPEEAKFPIAKRPGFKKDKAFKSSPKAADYAKTGYDRGHMAPNYAIMSRFGEEAQRKTFLMSNVVPQTPELNRGIWREIEHRSADLFTSKWGNVWVIVGAISEGCETLSGTDIDVPTAFYQIIAVKSDSDIRAVAFLCNQEVPWKTWPRHYIVSIDELEERTGFDFFSELDDPIEEKLESQTPTRLLPTGFINAFKSLKIHFKDF